MYYFIYRGEVIPDQILNKLVIEIDRKAIKTSHRYTFNEERNSIAVSQLFISCRENQIMVSSPYDYCEGCLVTDAVIQYILSNLGSMYTVIEP